MKVAGWVSSSIEKFPVLGKVIGGLAGGFVLTASAIGLVTAAQWAWNAAWLANPIVAGIALVAGAIYLLWDNWDWVVEQFNFTIKWWGEAFEGLATSIQESWGNVTDWFGKKTESWVDTFTSMSGGLKKAWKSITDWFGKKLDWIKGKVGFIGDAWSSIFGNDSKPSSSEPSSTRRKRSRNHVAAAAIATIAAATPAMAQPAAITNNQNIQITVAQQPGQNGADLVDELEREIKRRKMQRNRGAMSDAGDF